MGQQNTTPKSTQQVILDHTPLDKAIQNFQRHYAEHNDNCDYYVFVTTGALNPVHLTHVRMMELAKEFLEKKHIGTDAKPIKVIAGYLSPSHDYYTSRKLGDDHINSDHRLKMVDLAVLDSDWLSSDPWECKQAMFVDLSWVTIRLGQFLQEKVHPSIKVAYVCGADLVVRCRMRSSDFADIISVGRKQYSDAVKEVAEDQVNDANNPYKIYFVENDEEYEQLSSTLAREKLRNGEDISGIVHERVAQYLAAELSHQFSK